MWFLLSGSPLEEAKTIDFRSLSPGRHVFTCHSLLRALSRRSGSSVPPSLVEEASWAAPRFAPFARQALSLTVRRSLAMCTRDSAVSPVEAEARIAQPPQAPPEDPRRGFDAPGQDQAD